MKRIWKVALSLMIILLVGGGVAYTMGINKDYFRYLELKDYTEDYISPSQKNKEFVTYNSKNGKFSLDFPKTFFILEELHGSSKKYEDVFVVYLDPETKKSSNNIKILYQQLAKESVGYTLDDMLSVHSYDGQYEEISLEDRTIYKGEAHRKAEGKVTSQDPVKNGANYFFALVVDNTTFEAVEVTYSIECFEEDETKCEWNEAEERKTFEKIIDSISFE